MREGTVENSPVLLVPAVCTPSVKIQHKWCWDIIGSGIPFWEMQLKCPLDQSKIGICYIDTQITRFPRFRPSRQGIGGTYCLGSSNEGDKKEEEPKEATDKVK